METYYPKYYADAWEDKPEVYYDYLNYGNEIYIKIVLKHWQKLGIFAIYQTYLEVIIELYSIK